MVYRTVACGGGQWAIQLAQVKGGCESAAALPLCVQRSALGLHFLRNPNPTPSPQRRIAMLAVARRAGCTARSSSSLLHGHLLGVAALLARKNFSSASATTVTEDGSISYLRNSTNGAEVYLVGTAHVSAKSAEQVREVILLSLVFSAVVDVYQVMRDSFLIE